MPHSPADKDTEEVMVLKYYYSFNCVKIICTYAKEVFVFCLFRLRIQRDNLYQDKVPAKIVDSEFKKVSVKAK